MNAQTLLAALALVFLGMASSRALRHGGLRQPQARTWLLVAAIFGAVSAWLYYRG